MPEMPRPGPFAYIIAALWVATFGWMASASAQSTAVATVEELAGEVAVVRHATGESETLAVGAELFEGDRIRTGAAARARLRLRDGSILVCGEATELTLEWVLFAPDEDTRNVLLRVPLGIVRAVVEFLVPRSAFDMHTNTAVISARGTQWIAEADVDATAIVALDGEVAVQNVDPAVPGAVTLGPGEGVTVEAGLPPPEPSVWGDARRNAFIERTTVP